jgi:methylase of polypeptide subunit release factors
MRETTEAGPTTQSMSFGSLEIIYDRRVLRPRAWTTAQSWWAASLLPQLPDGPVLELCSGAGQIGLLAISESDRQLICVDVNPVAASYTLANASTAGLSGRVTVREGLIADSLQPHETFPLIIADPPWVPRAETERFPEDPLVAIDGGEDGLHIVRDCLAAIAHHLAPGGVALLQLGTVEQAAAVASGLGSDLVAGELREYGDRGVLLRIDHPA